jgi:ubiquitin-conjugating enzyme E2 A
MSRSSQLQRRLLKEYKKVQEDKNKAFTATIDPENITKWNAAVFGPDGTEWEGGVFRLTVVFDILQHNWSAAYELASVLTSVQALLIDPNPQWPANNEAAVLFTENRAEYNRRVKRCVESTWSSTGA